MKFMVRGRPEIRSTGGHGACRLTAPRPPTATFPAETLDETLVKRRLNVLQHTWERVNSLN